MSHNDTNDLIDEQELRDALQTFRPDRDAFEAGVRRRVEAGRVELAKRLSADDSQPFQAAEQSQWLHVAASVIPFSMLGNAASGGAPIPLGKLSIGYKLVGYAALPATTLLLMIGATIFGLIRIRSAQRSPQPGGDQAQQAIALAYWWKRFGLVAGCSFIFGVALMFFGYAVPVFLVFLGSGIAMVSLVTCLGRAGMIDRRAIGGPLVMGLAFLAQVAHLVSLTNTGVHLLDQCLVLALLEGTAVLLAIALSFTARDRSVFILGSASAICFGIVIVGFFARTLWSPVTTGTLKNYVESFDEARFHSASWQRWAVAATWLQDAGVSLDLSKPRRLLEREISEKQHYIVLGIAFDTNLIEPDDLVHLRNFDWTKTQLLSEHLRDRPILGIHEHDYAIRVLVGLGQLTESERDIVEERLLATLREIETSNSPIVEALMAIRLLEVLGRPFDNTAVHDSVHHLLVELQRTRAQSGMRFGGFALYRNLDSSDDLTTAAAVELMQRYGVPADVDIMALRSYLRPSRDDHRQMLQSAVRVATRQRLESIAGLRPITAWDYVQYEQSLWMSLLVALLCLYATLGAPIRVVDAKAS